MTDRAGDIQQQLRRLPSVNDLAEAARTTGVCESLDSSWSTVVRASRIVVSDARQEMLSNGAATEFDCSTDALVGRVSRQIESMRTGPLPMVINGTGIIIHTGLGRAPMAEHAARAMYNAAVNYVPAEINLSDGQRGHRSHLVRPLICELTGAESATVVNNCAASVMLALGILPRGSTVLVSRGELVEIGGSFRMPAIMEAAGVRLREVGTTNRTRTGDFRRAMDDSVSALLKVHASNFRIVGFTAEAPTDALSELATKAGIPLIHDVGSGLLHDDHQRASDEPIVQQSIRDGAHLVLFSGDKLLGGPQAGIAAGKTDLIDRMERHPMRRALRLDKTILAALAATLELHLDVERWRTGLPIYALLETSVDELTRRAGTIRDAVARARSDLAVTVEPSDGYIGGGSTPDERIAGCALHIRHESMKADALARALRLGRPGPAVMPRVADDAVIVDMRAVFPGQDLQLIAALNSAGLAT